MLQIHLNDVKSDSFFCFLFQFILPSPKFRLILSNIPFVEKLSNKKLDRGGVWALHKSTSENFARKQTRAFVW